MAGDSLHVARTPDQLITGRGGAKRTAPIIFLKAPSTVNGPGEAIDKPTTTERVDYEVELAVMIVNIITLDHGPSTVA